MKKPPGHLSIPARRFWSTLQREYEIVDAGGLSLLNVAADSWDRCREARELIGKQGAVVQDRFGQWVPHPAVRIEHAARGQLLQALKAMNLDLEPLAKRAGRPGGDPYFGG